MPDLRDQIRRYFESIAPPVEAQPSSPEPGRRLRPVVAWAVGAAVVAVPTLLLWGLFGRAAEPEPTIPPATTATTTVVTTVPPTTVTTPEVTTTQPPPTTTGPPATEAIGTWIPIPDGPWAYPHTIRAWTGTELLVFPEYVFGLEAPTTGLAHDPATGEWRELAPAPELRSQPAVVWTGSEFLVWGGMVEQGVDGYVLSNTGFAYDPATDAWSAIPTAPLEPQTYTFHVWTGEELIVWGGSVVVGDIFLGGSTTGAAYDPVAGEWRTLAESPLGSRNPGVSVWTGTEMIIGGNGDQTDGDASWAAYNPATDSWRVLPDPPIRAGGVYSGTWTGDEVVFSKSLEGGASVYALDPGSGEWRQAADPRRSLSRTSSVWTGDYIVFWGETGRPGAPLTQVAYDPATDTWTPLSDSPLRARFAHQATTVVGPNTVLIWGGAGFELDSFSDGAILVLAATVDSAEFRQVAGELISLLIPLAGDLSRAGDLPWESAGVGLGLGETVIRTVDPADLADPSSWVFDVDFYNGATGPFSILDAIERMAGGDDLSIEIGPHDHCASPPKAAPPGYEGLRRVSVQPASFDSCLQWWTIDLFVTSAGNVRAITYDFWEP